MEIGIAGLGKMGGRMAERLLIGGHRVIAFDTSSEALMEAAHKGAVVADTVQELALKLAHPRTVWLMLPAGEVTGGTIGILADTLSPGDIVVDGGNSHYKDSMRRAGELARKGIRFIDAGVSGGVWGLENGYGIVVGGERESVAVLSPALKTLAPAPDRGWAHVGPAGAGHFVKMVHNGIEYGLMQSYAEGFGLLAAKEEFGLDLENIASVWRHGTVIRSWLLDLAAEALKDNPGLEGVSPEVADSGEGRWTVAEAVELGVPAPAISASLMSRFESRGKGSFGNRFLSALRNRFGGHAYRKD